MKNILVFLLTATALVTATAQPVVLATGTNPVKIEAGNGNVGFGLDQILLSYGGGPNYSHSIKSRHNSGSISNNAIDFFLWQPGDALGATGSNLVMSLNGGNVGIGNTYPTQKLEVDGNILGLAENAAFGFDAQANARLGIIKKYGSWPIIASCNSSPIVFGQTDQADVFSNIAGATLTERMRIDVSGNVGIGTSAPDQKLSVKGAIHAQEVIIDLSVPGPDYVFEKNYALPSLEKVKSYIEQYHHLPEVQSAKEMETNGMKTGEMNMMLLKKVEELTLYVIELKERIDKIEKRK